MDDRRGRRPRAFLTAEWRYLAMLNYRIAPAALAAYVPAETELDTWRGDALVSLVGFRFLRTRVLRVAVPLHRDFDEVNLRLYVRARRRHEIRRGVVFIREIVASRVIAWVARLTYNEPYLALPMRSEVPPGPSEHPRTVAYSWRSQSGWNRLSVEAAEAEPTAPAAGSEGEFITEHHWGYTRQRDGSTLEYEVTHPPWRVWPVTRAHLECDAAALYGPAFAEALGGPPCSAFLAEGSAVTVHAPRRVDGDTRPGAALTSTTDEGSTCQQLG